MQKSQEHDPTPLCRRPQFYSLCAPLSDHEGYIQQWKGHIQKQRIVFNFRDITSVPPTHLRPRTVVPPAEITGNTVILVWPGVSFKRLGYREISMINDRIDNILVGRCALKEYIPTILGDGNSYIFLDLASLLAVLLADFPMNWYFPSMARKV